MSCSDIPQASWEEVSWVKQTTGFLCEASPATRPDSNGPVRKTSAPPRLLPGSYLHLRDTRERLGDFASGIIPAPQAPFPSLAGFLGLRPAPGGPNPADSKLEVRRWVRRERGEGCVSRGVPCSERQLSSRLRAVEHSAIHHDAGIGQQAQV